MNNVFELEVNTNWTATDFRDKMSEIKSENAGRKELSKYAQYGAFHAWKANNTDFHDKVTYVLNSGEFNGCTNTVYIQLVLQVTSAWMTFCQDNLIPTSVSVPIATQYVSREMAKIGNWVAKSLKFDVVA